VTDFAKFVASTAPVDVRLNHVFLLIIESSYSTVQVIIDVSITSSCSPVQVLTSDRILFGFDAPFVLNFALLHIELRDISQLAVPFLRKA
jgi:hypothetical protein